MQRERCNKGKQQGEVQELKTVQVFSQNCFKINLMLWTTVHCLF